MADLFPVFLKLHGRRCLVVGAGNLAEQKLGGLLSAGGDVHVVAPEANPHVKALVASGRVQWTAREFHQSDLEGMFLVIAATADPVVNEQIFQAANNRGVLCNAIDEPERCDFYYPAVVRRGDLQIAISTNGHSPALAQRLRAELEAMFGSDYAPWLQWLGSVRKLMLRRSTDPKQRRNTLHQIARREVYERFAAARARRSGGAR